MRPSRPLVYGPLVERMLEEREQLEHVSLVRTTPIFRSKLDAPPLQPAKHGTASAPGWQPSAAARYLQRVAALSSSEGARPRGVFLSNTTATVSSSGRISNITASSLSADIRQRDAAAATVRENVVLKARIADMERLLQRQYAELAELSRLRHAHPSQDGAGAERATKPAVLPEIDALLSRPDIESTEMIEEFVALVAAALHCEQVSLFFLSEDGHELFLKAANEFVPDIRVPIGQGVVGTVAQMAQLVNIKDAQSDPRFSQGSDRRANPSAVSVLCSVIQSPSGSVVGVLQATNRKPDRLHGGLSNGGSRPSTSANGALGTNSTGFRSLNPSRPASAAVSAAGGGRLANGSCGSSGRSQEALLPGLSCRSALGTPGSTAASAPGAPAAVPFSADDEQLLLRIVERSSTFLCNAARFDLAVSARLRAQALLDLVSCVALERNFAALTETVSDIVKGAMGASDALLLMFNHERRELWAMPRDERPGWSISFPPEPTDAPTLGETITARHGELAAAAAAQHAARLRIAARAGSSSGDSPAVAADGSGAGVPAEAVAIDVSWLAWQVARTCERLNSAAHGGLLASLDVLRETEPAAAAAAEGASAENSSLADAMPPADDRSDASADGAARTRTASALLVSPCVDRQGRPVAVLIVAGKERARTSSEASRRSARGAAEGGAQPRYFSAHDEELISAICGKLSLALEVRSADLMTSKVAIDMAADDEEAGGLVAFDLAEVNASQAESASSVSKEKRKTLWQKRRSMIMQRQLTLSSSIQASAMRLDISRLQRWDLDLFAMGDSELHAVALTCVNTFELPAKLGFSSESFLQLCTQVRARYRDNPYHNYRHAISVMQASFLVLTTTDAGARLKHTAVLAILLASLFHDIDHPGTNNAFQVNSSSPLAILYNDQSVLENHHAAQAFQLMRDHADLDVLRGLSTKDRASVRNEILHCILSTDMAKHFSLLNQLKQISPQAEEHTAADQLVIMEAIVHAADLSNPLLEGSIARKWSDAVLVEFNNQAAQEQQLGLPFDPNMLKSDIVSQANLNRGFIDYIVAPLWQALAEHFPPLESGVAQMMENRAMWDRIITDEKPGLVQRRQSVKAITTAAVADDDVEGSEAADGKEADDSDGRVDLDAALEAAPA